jgi:hypothetical protein
VVGQHQRQRQPGFGGTATFLVTAISSTATGNCQPASVEPAGTTD